MPRRKITDDNWDEMLRAYDAWDPSEPGSPSIADVLAPFDIAKQTFYNELKRRGLPLKGAKPTADGEAFTAVLEALVAARIRIKLLEQQLVLHGIPLP
jgi:hypothetical protein